LHRFSSWSRPILTDSGGFQVFSLAGLRTISEQGVVFTSHIDGSVRTLTPESSMEIQWALGADVAMAFDHVVPGQASRELAEQGMEQTRRWLDRKQRHAELSASRRRQSAKPKPADLPACRLQQTSGPSSSGTHADLRERRRGDFGPRTLTGIAIGGLSVGERSP
jgi:queuine tRNA-ribosyltransferase